MASVRERIKKFKALREDSSLFMAQFFEEAQKEITEMAQNIVSSGMHAILTETQNIINRHAKVLAEYIESEKPKLKAMRGDPGYTPQKGVDYFDGKDADEQKIITTVLKRIPPPKQGEPGRTPIAGIDFPMPQNGKDGSEMTPEEWKKKGKELPVKERWFDEGHIKGLEKYALKTALAALESRLTSLASRQRFGGGGGAAGGGGGGGGTLQRITITGTVDGSNDTFTLDRRYSFLALYWNGQLQEQTVHYTVSGTTVTFLAGHIPTDGTLHGYGQPG